MEDKNKRLIRYLNDSYAAEVGGLMALKDLALMATDEPGLKSVIEDHILVTQSQAERLRNRILALGGDKSEPKAIVNSVIAKGSSVVNMFHDKEDKLTQDLIKAYSFEHFEIGTYMSLSSYAESIGDTETALLAVQIMEEERLAASQLERFIPACAQKAGYRTTEFQPTAYSGDSRGSFHGIPTVALLIPGAVLAAWGVSKWLQAARDKDHNEFRTAKNATSYGTDYRYTERSSVATPELAVAGTSRNTTVYSSDNAYVPSSLERESSSQWNNSSTSATGSASAFTSPTVRDSAVDDFRTTDSRPEDTVRITVISTD